MPRTYSEVVAWAKSNPHPHQGGTWNLRCEQFVNNAGGFNYGFPTAIADYHSAKNAGALVSPAQASISDIPTGWILFWDYGQFGHVAFKSPGNRALMASSFLDERFGTSAVGYVNAPSYATRTGHRYLGASPFHGPETLEGIHMLTAADKAWIKDAIADAVKAERDDIADAVWNRKGKSLVSGKSTSVWGQVFTTRKDGSEIKSLLADIKTALNKDAQ